MSVFAVVSSRGADRVRAGHPWIYRSDVVTAEAAPGDLVRVVSDRDRRLGWAFWSSTSQIALRMISDETSAATLDTRAWLAARLDAAYAYRQTLQIGASAYRLVHGEGDRFPALIVDVYQQGADTYLVVQTLCQASDRLLPEIVEWLRGRYAPKGILARNDPKVRRLEGLAEQIEVLHGEVPQKLTVQMGAIRTTIDLRLGQKTGSFLDQRENHEAALGYGGRRVLDAFTYHGGFALPLAHTAESVLAIDSSVAAVAATRENARLNGFTNVEVREANVFDELRELEISRAVFDTIVLDPPAFAKNKASVERAIAGYKEINLRALKLLAPGGHLITCSCSYNVDEGLFLDIVHAASVDAGAHLMLVEKRMQARDHPVVLGVPETHYLKCLVVRKM